MASVAGTEAFDWKQSFAALVLHSGLDVDRLRMLDVLDAMQGKPKAERIGCPCQQLMLWRTAAQVLKMLRRMAQHQQQESSRLDSLVASAHCPHCHRLAVARQIAACVESLAPSHLAPEKSFQRILGGYDPAFAAAVVAVAEAAVHSAMRRQDHEESYLQAILSESMGVVLELAAAVVQERKLATGASEAVVVAGTGFSFAPQQHFALGGSST